MPSRNLDKNNLQLIRHNASLVKKVYPNINRARIQAPKELTKQFSFSSASGDVILLENGWFVTHTGPVRLARRKRCRGIHVEAVDSLCDSAAHRFVLKATVYPSKDSAGFVGYGDADPSNVSLLVRGAAMRIAETRAVNRALRKAYGIGICSVEEIGSKAYYLMSIHEHLPPQVRRELKQMPKAEFQREVEKELTGKDSEPSELVYFKVYKSQIPVIEQAIETAALMLGSDKSRGYCLEMICADFLAGACLDGNNPEMLLRSISRYYKFLPSPQQEVFLSEVARKAT